MTKENFETLLGKIKNDHEVFLTVQKAGGISDRLVQSDKLGYDWKETYIGDKLIMQEYVEQEVKLGTEENPIEYKEGCSLIDNAYYNKDGKVYLYMGGEFVEG